MRRRSLSLVAALQRLVFMCSRPTSYRRPVNSKFPGNFGNSLAGADHGDRLFNKVFWCLLVWPENALGSALGFFIFHIFFMITKKQMIGPYARSVVAFVKDVKASRDIAKMDLIGNAMRSVHSTVKPKSSVAASRTTYPFPTIMERNHLYFFIESIFHNSVISHATR